MFVAACHQASDQAKTTKNLCYKLLLCIPVSANRKETQEIQQKLCILAEQFESRNPVFTADGYYEINYSLITAVWTYMVSNLIVSLTFKNGIAGYSPVQTIEMLSRNKSF